MKSTFILLSLLTALASATDNCFDGVDIFDKTPKPCTCKCDAHPEWKLTPGPDGVREGGRIDCEGQNADGNGGGSYGPVGCFGPSMAEGELTCESEGCYPVVNPDGGPGGCFCCSTNCPNLPTN